MANKKSCLEQAGSWFMQEGVWSYIIDCYKGVEVAPSTKRPRRVFEWADEGGVYHGNAEAFLIHLGLRFGLNLKPSNACMVHALLRELGEEVLPSKKAHREPRDPNSPRKGKFKQPDPDKRKVR